MASGSAVGTYSSTLVASTVDTVTLGLNFRNIEICNRGATGDIFVTTDGVTAPTVGGNEMIVVPANTTAVVQSRVPPDEVITNFNLASQPSHSSGDTNRFVAVVKLISSGTPSYTVSGYSSVRTPG